jgi:hypothetical protein
MLCQGFRERIDVSSVMILDASMNLEIKTIQAAFYLRQHAGITFFTKGKE